MRTSRFWRTIDVLPGAASDRRDWRRRLRDEWAHVERLLKPTGRAATQVDCPSPGGENCPRTVVRHPDGSIRAVCGEPGKFCRDLELLPDDIAILEFDRQMLALEIADALSLVDRGRASRGFSVHRLGIHDVYAGRGFPVFLTLDDPIARLTVRAFSDVAAAPQPKIVLTPTPETLQRDVTDYLDGIGVRRLALSDILIMGDEGKFTTAYPVESLFTNERMAVSAGPPTKTRAWSGRCSLVRNGRS